jgi:hypothetical protein
MSPNPIGVCPERVCAERSTGIGCYATQRGPASGMTVLRGLDASMQLLPLQDTTSNVALHPRLPPLIAKTSFCALALQALH